MGIPVLGPCLQKGVLSEEEALWAHTCHGAACDPGGPSDRRPGRSGCGRLSGDSRATKSLVSEEWSPSRTRSGSISSDTGRLHSGPWRTLFLLKRQLGAHGTEPRSHERCPPAAGPQALFIFLCFSFDLVFHSGHGAFLLSGKQLRNTTCIAVRSDDVPAGGGR